MKINEYFKLQAKNLHKDFKTQKSYLNPSLSGILYEYAPNFFDVDALITDFDINEDSFTLMNAQHIIAKLAGFDKWTDMLTASPSALELSKLLFDNMHKIRNEEWEYYILDVENKSDLILADEDKLEIFKTVFADVDGHQSDDFDYRLSKREKLSNEKQIIKPKKNKNTVQITSLPLVEADRKELIKSVNEKFEDALQTIEPSNPGLVRKLWNPEEWIDEIITPDIVPIDRDYALSLVTAYLVHHVIHLTTEADMQSYTLK